MLKPVMLAVILLPVLIRANLADSSSPSRTMSASTPIAPDWRTNDEKINILSSDEPVTHAMASKFSPQLAAAMQAGEIAATTDHSADGVIELPASVTVKPPDKTGPPTMAGFDIHRMLAGETGIFELMLERSSGRWTYVSGTFRSSPRATPVDAEKNHAWLKQAIEDAQK